MTGYADFRTYLQQESQYSLFPRLPMIFKAARFQTNLFDDVFFEEQSVHLPPQRSQAVLKRRSEYFAGRYLAQQAMAEFGQKQFVLEADQHRCPLWPEGLRGSISHSDDFAICALARAGDYFAIGIDVQSWMEELPARRLATRILDEHETVLVEACPLSLAKMISLCFSAKESIFKGLYPHIGRHFGYNAARLRDIDWENEILYFDFDAELCPKALKDTRLPVHFRQQAERGTSLLALSIH